MARDLLATKPRDLLASSPKKRSAYENIVTGPAAALRAPFQGKGYQEGFDDPESVPMFQKTYPDAIQKLIQKVPGVTELPVDAQAALLHTGSYPAALAGMVTDSALNPVESLLGLATPGIAKGAGLLEDLIGSSMRKGAMKKATAEVTKGKDLVRELLPSPQHARDLKAGRQPGITSEGYGLIKPTKRPEDVFNKFKAEKEAVLSKVDQLVTENKQPVDPKFLFTRTKLLLRDSLKNASPEGRKQMAREFRQQLEWIKEQPEFTTVDAHARKKFLYQETKGLQQKQGNRVSIVASPERDLVKDKFAQALKEAVERTHPEISKLNSRFAGLEAGETAAAKLKPAKVRTFEQRLSDYLAGRIASPLNIPRAVSELPELIKGKNKIYELTKGISKSYDKSSKLAGKAGTVIDDLIKKPEASPTPLERLLAPDDIEALTGPREPLVIGSGGAFAGDNFEVLGKEASAKATLRSLTDPTTIKSTPKQSGFDYVPDQEVSKDVVSTGKSKKNMLLNEKGFTRGWIKNGEKKELDPSVSHDSVLNKTKALNSGAVRKNGHFDYEFGSKNRSSSIKTIKDDIEENLSVYIKDQQNNTGLPHTSIFIDETGPDGKLLKTHRINIEDVINGKLGKSSNILELSALTSGAAITAGGLASKKAEAYEVLGDTVGSRNNNPGNIKGDDKWFGSTGKDKQGHHKFETMHHGIRAGIKNLTTHKSKYADLSLTDYFSKVYAEENGKQEASFVAKKLGVPSTTKLKDIDPAEAFKAVAMFESKVRITDDDVKKAMSLNKKVKK